MKLKDLEAAQAAGTTVAYTRYGTDSDYAQEVKILNTRASRTVYTHARSFHGHAAPGVAVEFVGTERPGTLLIDAQRAKRDTVDQRHLVSTWDEYQELRAKRLERERQSTQHKEQSERAAHAAAARLKLYLESIGKKISYNAIEVVGIGGYSSGSHYRAPYAYGVRVASEALEWVMDEIDER